MWQSLSERFNLVAVDMLGFGFSSKPTNAHYSIFFQADVQHALLDHLGIKDFSILAHDYGDTVAQEMLARDKNQQHIKQVFLLNGGLFPETHRALFIQKLMLSKLGFLTPYFVNKGAFLRSFHRICAKPLNDTELDDIWTLLKHNNGVKVMPKLIGYMRERRLNRERWVGILEETQTPLVLINGSDDPISGSHMVARYRELVSNPKVYELAGVGHYPQLEAPREVFQIISDSAL